MQNLAQFLTRIQTFELRIVTKEELKSPIKEDEQKQAYSLTHQTQYYDSFSYKSEIRVLKDMALIDLLSLNVISLKRELDQLKKLKAGLNFFGQISISTTMSLDWNTPATTSFRYNFNICL